MRKMLLVHFIDENTQALRSYNLSRVTLSRDLVRYLTPNGLWITEKNFGFLTKAWELRGGLAEAWRFSLVLRDTGLVQLNSREFHSQCKAQNLKS